MVTAAAAAAAAQQQQPNGTPRPAAQPAQAVPQIRNQPVAQVNISQQQRMPTPMASTAVAGARISPQHLLQAQAAQARAISIAAAAQAQAQAQAPVQGSPVPTINGLPAGAHLSPPYQSRAATSSPGVVPQATPPRNMGTPSNAVSPRPPSAQPQLHMQPPQMPVNAVPRQAHYFPVVATHGGQFTQEQMDQALRLMQVS